MVQISVSRRHLVFLSIAVAVLVVVVIPLAVSAATQRFVDVPPTDWAYDDVEWLAANGYTEGCTTDGTEYCPDKPVTRREMAAFMHRLSGDGATTITGRLNALESDVATLEAKTIALDSENAALKALLRGVSRNGDTLLFTGMNLQVVNGKDDTKTSTGYGNVIIGYNSPDPFAGKGDRDGSHYLIIGDAHTYTAYAGIVSGLASESLAPYASVTGGKGNHANAIGASVTGGSNNWATNEYASVSGGWRNTASGAWSSVLGGDTQSATTGHSTYPSGP